MKTCLFYFSQTGNTKKIAEAMQGAFNDAGHDTQLIPLRKAAPGDAVAANLIGIGAPSFASQAPTLVKSFLWNLPDLSGKRAFVFATSGGGPGCVLYDMTAILRKKGATVLGGHLSRGEVFYPFPCMIGRFHGRPDAADLEAAKRFAATLSECLAKGPHIRIAENREDALRLRLGFYEMVGKTTSEDSLRLMLPEPKIDTKACTVCKRCARECPTDSITFEPDLKIGKHCIRCYRCVTVCPEAAFHMNLTFSNLALGALYNTRFERWFGDVKKGERCY